MPTSADPVLLLDTSAAIALVDVDHVHHAAVLDQVTGRRLGLAGHAVFETLSVLTRIPPPQRLSSAEAGRLVATNFPETRQLSVDAATDLVSELCARDIAGGAIYDGLVGAAARLHSLSLLTCDRRAVATYQALGVHFLLAV